MSADRCWSNRKRTIIQNVLSHYTVYEYQYTASEKQTRHHTFKEAHTYLLISVHDRFCSPSILFHVCVSCLAGVSPNTSPSLKHLMHYLHASELQDNERRTREKAYKQQVNNKGKRTIADTWTCWFQLHSTPPPPPTLELHRRNLLTSQHRLLLQTPWNDACSLASITDVNCHHIECHNTCHCRRC